MPRSALTRSCSAIAPCGASVTGDSVPQKGHTIFCFAGFQTASPPHDGQANFCSAVNSTMTLRLAGDRSANEPAHAFSHSQRNRKRRLRVLEEKRKPENRDHDERNFNDRGRRLADNAPVRSVDRDTMAAAEVAVLEKPERQQQPLGA